MCREAPESYRSLSAFRVSAVPVRARSTVIRDVEMVDDLRQNLVKPVARLNSKVGMFHPHLTLIYYSA